MFTSALKEADGIVMNVSFLAKLREGINTNQDGSSGCCRNAEAQKLGLSVMGDEDEAS